MIDIFNETVYLVALCPPMVADGALVVWTFYSKKLLNFFLWKKDKKKILQFFRPLTLRWSRYERGAGFNTTRP